MSVHVAKDKTAGEATKTAVFADGQKPRYHLHLKVGAVVAVCVVVLGAVIVGGVVLVRNHVDSPATPAKSAAAFPAGVTTPSQQADYLANTNSVAAAQTVLTKSAATLSGVALQNSYLQQATIAFNAQMYADAMMYAKKAEAALPTDQTAALEGQVAAKQGDSKAATSYYQLAISRLDKSSKTYNLQLSEYQADIQDLQP